MGKQNDAPRLSPVETMVMGSVWKGNKTTRTIYDGLPEATKERLAFSTISTYLMRMVVKGYLTRTPTTGREFEYTPCVTKEAAEEQRYKHIEPEDDLLGTMLRRFAGRDIFGENEKTMLHQLAKFVDQKFRGKERKPKK